MSDNKEKQTLLDIFNAWGPVILTIIIPTGAGLTGNALGLSKNWIIGIVTVLVIVFLIATFIWFFRSHIKARFKQWNHGKFKGLWADKALKKQVKKLFLNSSTIKIKVTRGTELIERDNHINILEELKVLKEKSNQQNPITVQILLMAPCFKIKHVRQRFETHKGKYNKPDEFLKSWKKTLQKLSEYTDDYCKINVKFYYGGHSRWRFYVCTNEKGDNRKIVLLSNYDKNTSGSTTPMYKIVKGEKNIGDFMDKYFDEIWNDSITLKQLIKYIQDEKCTRLFCEQCKNGHNKKELCADSCPGAKCEHLNSCKQRASELEDFLRSLSNTARTHISAESK